MKSTPPYSVLGKTVAHQRTAGQRRMVRGLLNVQPTDPVLLYGSRAFVFVVFSSSSSKVLWEGKEETKKKKKTHKAAFGVAVLQCAYKQQVRSLWWSGCPVAAPSRMDTSYAL